MAEMPGGRCAASVVIIIGRPKSGKAKGPATRSSNASHIAILLASHAIVQWPSRTKASGVGLASMIARIGALNRAKSGTKTL